MYFLQGDIDPVHHHKVPFIPMGDQGKLCLFQPVKVICLCFLACYCPI